MEFDLLTQVRGIKAEMAAADGSVGENWLLRFD